MQVLAYFLAGLFLWPMDGSENYPVWFVQMPEEEGIIYAVGYARAYATYDSAAAMASRDARYQLNLAIQNTVRGERLFQMLPDGQIVYQGETFEEKPVDETVPVYLDTVQTGGMVMVLAASRRPPSPVTVATTSLNPTPPAWITALPDTPHTIYAVGMSRLYYYEENSWLEAERQARQEIAYSFWTRQRQLVRGTHYDTAGVTASATSVVLQDLQVMARWRSETMCFVLMRAGGGKVVP